MDTNTATIQGHIQKYEKEVSGINTTIEGLQTTVNTLTERMDTAECEAIELREDNARLRKRLS